MSCSWSSATSQCCAGCCAGSRPEQSRSPRRRADERAPRRFVFAALIAGSAFGGTIGLATGALDLGPTLNQRLPLHSPVLGGLALAIIVGVPAMTVAVMIRRRDERAGRFEVAAGALLIAWILVEIGFIREFSFLQPFYAAVGLVFIAIGRHAGHRQLT